MTSGWFEMEIGPLLTTAVALFAIFVTMARSVARSQRRTSELDAAAELLDKHHRALKEFLESPAAPAHMKEKLVIFSSVVSDRQVVREIVAQACAAERASKGALEAPEIPEAERERKQLRVREPEVARAFEAAVSSGVMAMLVRWPETAETFFRFIASVTADTAKEAAIFERAVRRGTEQRRRDDNPMNGPRAAMAQ